MSLDYAEVVRLIRKGRTAEKRGKAVSGCITALIVSYLGALFDGWLLMLAVGIAHAVWWPDVPTIGYWWAVLMVALLRGVFSPVGPVRKNGDRS
jgi:hypothetical protein